MSPNVGNFVHDLVEMAKAMETLPQVEAERDRLNRDYNSALVTVADRETTILRLKTEIEAHLATIRKLEVDRDHAELMFLELDERTHKVLANVKNAMDQLDQTVSQLDPPKPQPAPAVSKAMAVSSPEPVSGVIETKPMEGFPGNPVPGTFSEPGVSVEPLPIAPETQPETGNDAISTGVNPTGYASQPTMTTETPLPVIGRDTPPVDDVGYHNEPNTYNDEWYHWADRMDKRHGYTNWPSRVVA